MPPAPLTALTARGPQALVSLEDAQPAGLFLLLQADLHRRSLPELVGSRFVAELRARVASELNEVSRPRRRPRRPRPA
jgi:hypothetical protein